MPQFDIVTARLILALARYGSIARAAQHEGIASSAVSRRIAELENRSGTVLFDRSAQGVRLTDAGQVYAEGVRSILQQIADLEVRMADFAAGKAGRLRLACTTSALSGDLPELLAAFASAHPTVKLDIREMYGSATLQALTDSDVDLAVLTDNHNLAAFEVHAFSTDDVWLIAAPDHPLALRLRDGKPLPFAAALGHEMVGFHHSGALDRLVSEASEKAGQPMGERVTVETISALVRMVEAGFGIGFLRHSSLHLLAGTDLLAVPLADEWAKRNMLVAMRKNAPRAAPVREFLRLLTLHGKAKGCKT